MGLQRILGLGSDHTAWNWLLKLRRARGRPRRDRLAGAGAGDEVYIGGERPGKRGRGATGKALVLVAAQAEGGRMGRLRLARIADAAKATLTSAVKAGGEPGAQGLTDAWDGDHGLAAEGDDPRVVRATALGGENLLPRANRVTSLLQRWLLGTHPGAVAHSQLDYDLDEFTFRFNRRTSRSRDRLFYRLLEHAVALDPVLARALVGGRVCPKP